MNNCPCDNQSKSKGKGEGNDTMQKAKQRYEVKKVTVFFDKVCDKCGKIIPANSEYIHESWLGDKILCESRNFHVGCFGKELGD